MVALKKNIKKNSQTERIMLKETSIILGKNSNPMKKKTVLTIKSCTEHKINIQYSTCRCYAYSTILFLHSFNMSSSLVYILIYHRWKSSYFRL